MMCNESNPNSVPDPSITNGDLQGSWIVTKVHAYGYLNDEGDNETWDSTYSPALEHPEAEMWKFSINNAVRYDKEGDICFHKSDSIPYAVFGNNLIGDFWNGETCENQECFKWSYSIKKAENGLILTLIEVESYKGTEFCREVWECFLEARSISLDELANNLQNCTSQK